LKEARNKLLQDGKRQRLSAPSTARDNRYKHTKLLQEALKA
jgi:hypothetical protein